MLDDTVSRALTQLYDLGVQPDWWKLPPQTAKGWELTTDLLAVRDPHCQGVVLLGLAAGMAEVKQGFAIAAQYPVCKGFTVGRTLFAAAAQEWLAGKIDDAAMVSAVAGNYVELIEAWRGVRHPIKSLSTSI